MTDVEFLRAFERGEIDKAEFNHLAHVRLALAYLADSRSLDEATERMANALRGFAAAAGHPEKYHHTITVFWMRMVARLLDKNLLLAYYSRERLWSEAARTGWLEPDLQTIHGPTPGPSHSPSDASHRPVPR